MLEKKVMHVRANLSRCIYEHQLVNLLISLYIQEWPPVSNSSFHVLGTDYHYVHKGMQDPFARVAILMSLAKRGTNNWSMPPLQPVSYSNYSSCAYINL